MAVCNKGRDDGIIEHVVKHTYVTVSRKRMRSAQNLECEFYISADSVKRAL